MVQLPCHSRGIIHFTHVVPSPNFALSQLSLLLSPNSHVPDCYFYFFTKKIFSQSLYFVEFSSPNFLYFFIFYFLILKASLPSFTNLWQQCYLSCTLCAVFDDHFHFICGCMFCWAAEWSCGQTADDSRKGAGTGGEGVQVCVWRLWPPLHHAPSPEGNLKTGKWWTLVKHLISRWALSAS